MTYRYSLEDLLNLLHGYAPAKVDAIALDRRRIEHGLLSIGLKIHCIGDGTQFTRLAENLGRTKCILDANSYKHSNASCCLVLPPVGSARSAISLLECIAVYIGSNILASATNQIQVCSPGRLNAHRSALLGIGFYLGSDKVRRYSMGDLETTFSESTAYPRGKRLVLYDANGDFERTFPWWTGSDENRIVEPNLPFSNGRSDVLVGSGSKQDVENINLISTLLVHAQYGGYWKNLGQRFEADMLKMLDEHVLIGLLEAPWIRTDDAESADDERFFAALQELVAYTFQEVSRLRKLRSNIRNRWFNQGETPLDGILVDMQRILQKYRRELVTQSRILDRAGGEAS
jgi:hypothetical protein